MSSGIRLHGVLGHCKDGRLSFTGTDEKGRAHEDVNLDDLIKQKMKSDDRDNIKDVKEIKIELDPYSSNGP